MIDGSALDGHVAACDCPACLNSRDDADRANDPVVVDDGTSAGSEASLNEMADYLRLDYWDNDVGTRHNLGETGYDPNNGVLYYNLSGTDGDLPYSGGLNDADGISADRAALVRDAFDVYEAVLGIDFVETTDTDTDVVDFFFIDNEDGAFASSPLWEDGTLYASYINVAVNWSGGTSTYDDYTLQTIFHEIGHALGLGHQGRYNGTGGYDTDALYVNDSWQASMMSYFSQTENTAIDASFEYLQTPMAVDWLALDDIYSQWGYGTANAFTGDTVYGFNTTISADTSRIWNEFSDYAYRTASTVIDAGGTDTIDFSGYDTDQRIDLTVQTRDMTSQNTSDIGGGTGNLTLAIGTVIENAISGSGNDALVGNEADNMLMGGAGDDTLSGKSGDDILHGGDGTDTALFDSLFADFDLKIVDDRTSLSLTDIQSSEADADDGQDIVFADFEFIRFGDNALSSIELNDDGLISSINTEDDAGALLAELSISEEGITSYSLYSGEMISINAVTEANGDVRTTVYGEDGKRDTFTFEDGSDSQSWAQYTETYDDEGIQTEYAITYDNGDTLHREYANGIIVVKTQTEADGDVKTTLYGEDGTRDTFTFEDGSNSRSWTNYTKTYDDEGIQAQYGLVYDNGDTLDREYANGTITVKTLTEADGDVKTTLYGEDGTLDTFTFEDGSNSRGWTNYTKTYDDEGIQTRHDLAYDNGNTLAREYANGTITVKTLTEADGDVKTTLYGADGTRDTFTFEDGSETRDWASYTNTYDDEGIQTQYDLAYDNGNTLHREYANGIIAINALTETDGDVRTTLYGEDGIRDTFTFEDGSETRNWTSYTNTYDDEGAFLERSYFYDIA